MPIRERRTFSKRLKNVLHPFRARRARRARRITELRQEISELKGLKRTQLLLEDEFTGNPFSIDFSNISGFGPNPAADGTQQKISKLQAELARLEKKQK